MFSKLKSLAEGFDNYMKDRIEVAKNILSDKEARITLGFMLSGLGVGLLASVYITPPKK